MRIIDLVMEARELRKIRLRLGLSLKEMSQLLETPYRTYQDWELGNRRIPGICDVALFCLLRCKSAFKARRKICNKGINKKKEVYIMGREVILFETEERKSAAEIAAFLRQLADKIDSGKLILKSGAKEVDLALPGNLILEVKVEEEDKKGKTKRSLEVELEWIVGEDGGTEQGVEIV